MAKITLPSYIKEGHGRMEDAVIVTRGDKSFMKVYKKYDRGSTPKQLQVREAFTTVVADWSYLEGIISDAWDMSSGDPYVSGYNAFLGENLSRRRDGEPLILCPGMGQEILVNFTAEPGTVAGEVICSFLPAEPGCHVTFFTRRVTMPGEKSPLTRHDAGADAQSPFTITGLEPGAEYHLFAVVTEAAYENASTVSASVATISTAG